jgi:hypothetical protein
VFAARVDKKIIGVDIDNVLSDTDFMIRKLIAKEYNVKSTREQMGMYRKVCKWLKLGTGLQSEWQAG